MSADSPTQEPMEPKRHQEFNHDDTDDEYERDVEDDFRGDATDAGGVDGTDFDDFDETIADVAVAETGQKMSDVVSANFCVQSPIAEIIKDRGVVDLSRIQPLQQIQIENVPEISLNSREFYTQNKPSSFEKYS